MSVDTSVIWLCDKLTLFRLAIRYTGSGTTNRSMQIKIHNYIPVYINRIVISKEKPANKKMNYSEDGWQLEA